MANEFLFKDGTPFLFADHATDFGAAPATAANDIINGATVTDVQLDLTGVASAGGGRASAKVTLGATVRARRFRLEAVLENETAPADGGYFEFLWAPSRNATAANGNPAGLTGVDEAFTVTVGKLAQMQPIGVLGARNAVINIGRVGIFTPYSSYGMLVVLNYSSTALRSTATAMDETHLVLTPMPDELQ
jgi:hypothetical protein